MARTLKKPDRPQRISPGSKNKNILGRSTHYTQSLRDQAYEAIKHRLMTCAFRPGEYINEIKVANLIGIGRTPVHQALDQLRLEGLVDVIPRKGVFVKPVNFNEVMQVIEIRLLNEVYSVRLAAQRADQNDIAELGNIRNQAKRSMEQENFEQMMILDTEFHRLIARAAKNPVLSEVLRNLTERSTRMWFISVVGLEHYQTIQDEHEEIIEHISRRDPDAAEAAMRSHFASFRSSIFPDL